MSEDASVWFPNRSEEEQAEREAFELWLAAVNDGRVNRGDGQRCTGLEREVAMMAWLHRAGYGKKETA